MSEIPQFRIDVSDLDLPDIITQAKIEVFQERRRAAIEKEKARLRAHKWWHRFIPVITITWRTK